MHQIGRVSLKCLQILAVGLKFKKKNQFNTEDWNMAKVPRSEAAIF